MNDVTQKDIMEVLIAADLLHDGFVRGGLHEEARIMMRFAEIMIAMGSRYFAMAELLNAQLSPSLSSLNKNQTIH